MIFLHKNKNLKKDTLGVSRSVFFIKNNLYIVILSKSFCVNFLKNILIIKKRLLLMRKSNLWLWYIKLKGERELLWNCMKNIL